MKSSQRNEIRYCHECGRPLNPNKKTVLAIVFMLIILGVAILGIVHLEIQLQSYESKVALLDIQLKSLRTEKDEIQNERMRLVSELSHYKLKRPTFNELVMFLANDGTDGHRYDPDSYVCVNFAHDLKTNAARVGWNISFVDINFYDKNGDGWGHSCNGAYLADGSWVWIEPQTDRIYSGSVETYLQDFQEISYVRVIQLVVIW